MTTEVVSREAVIEALGRIVTPGAKMLALADDMGLRKTAYPALRAILAQLCLREVRGG